jgi:cysteine synthase
VASSREWVAAAIALVERDVVTTPLRTLPIPPGWEISLRLKDESAQPSGSLKHRLLRTLYAHALAAGQITEGTTIVQATAGPAAVAGAHFAACSVWTSSRLCPALHIRRRPPRSRRLAGAATRIIRQPRSTPRRGDWPPILAGSTWTTSQFGWRLHRHLSMGRLAADRHNTVT